MIEYLFELKRICLLNLQCTVDSGLESMSQRNLISVVERSSAMIGSDVETFGASKMRIEKIFDKKNLFFSSYIEQ
jgi:hypothetical protein